MISNTHLNNGSDQIALALKCEIAAIRLQIAALNLRRTFTKANFIPATRVSDYGAMAQKLYDEKPWK